ncbi:MAG: hypothetical protein OIN83_07400 [Candidatus Methanoperedens sp.]|nr:hypothetical protein [Candidatus Methanoperedens sp.]
MKRINDIRISFQLSLRNNSLRKALALRVAGSIFLPARYILAAR